MPPFDAELMHWPTIAAFTAYLQGVPRPSWCTGITNHNTYQPDERNWAGMASMRSLVAYYRDTKQWPSGPHLFLAAAAPNAANTGIFQLTPIARPGTHAGACNAHNIGIENVGNFDARPPTLDQYTLLLAVNRAILEHWGIPPASVNVHNECMLGRTCPGKHLTGTQIRADLSRPWPRPPSHAITPASSLLWEPRATPEQCAAFILSRPHGEYTFGDVRSIVQSYFTHATGLDPLLAIAQLCHETGYLTSWWAARPRRNPAGLGVTGETRTKAGDGWVRAGAIYRRGLTFASWDDAAQAHIGRLLAYCIPLGGGTPAQRARIDAALALRSLPATYRGAAPTLQGLNGRWAVPGSTYAQKIADIANAIVEDSNV